MPAVLIFERLNDTVDNDYVVTLCRALDTDLSAEASCSSDDALVANREVVATQLTAPLELGLSDLIGSNKGAKISPSNEDLPSSFTNCYKVSAGGIRTEYPQFCLESALGLAQGNRLCLVGLGAWPLLTLPGGSPWLTCVPI